MVLGELVVGWNGGTSCILVRRAVGWALMRMVCGRCLRVLMMDFAVWRAMMMLAVGGVDCHAPAMNLLILRVSP